MYVVLQLRTQVRALLAADKLLEALPRALQALTIAQQTLGLDDPYVALVVTDVARGAKQL